MNTQLISIEQKIGEFKEMFNNDPLYQKIESLGLMDKLFSEDSFFGELVWGFDYSTKQSAGLLGLDKNQTIINLLNRHDLESYFNVVQGTNGYYSYDHNALFQLKMAFLLMEHNVQPLDLAALIGTKTQYARGEKRRKEEPISSEITTDYIDQKFNENLQAVLQPFLERMNNSINLLGNNHKAQLERLEKETNLRIWEAEMRSLVNQIDTLEYQESIMKKSPKIEDNFFTKLFKIKTNDTDEIDGNLLGKIEQKKLKLVDEKNKLEKNKEILLKEISDLKSIEQIVTLDKG
ncbi:hypothetical protein MHH81_21015 [Psychrobacillus sp. FSL H8-0484]|uniref:hypothetical protein n=1 Tax=Psychrobacillus sp. FSL H8-0484 TaxID=2921390 RepID=UPI0030F5C921